MLYRLLTTGRNSYNDVSSFLDMIIVVSSDDFKVLTLEDLSSTFAPSLT